MRSSISTFYDEVSETQLEPLGFVLERIDNSNPGRGSEEWIYVQASVNLVAGDVCMRAIGNESYVVRKAVASTHEVQVVGVAQHAIPADSYGFIQRQGIAVVAASTAIAVDTPFVVSTTVAGEVEEITYGVGANAAQGSFGFATTVLGAPGDVTAFIDCRG